MTDTIEDPQDTVAQQIVKLIEDLDVLIVGMKSEVPATKAWQRQFRGLLSQADREIQVLRMTEALQKPDREILEAAAALGSTCRRIGLAVQGSRADGVVRSAAKTMGQMGETLQKLMRQEIRPELGATECRNGC